MLLRTIRQIMQRRIFLHEQKIADLEKSMKLRAYNYKTFQTDQIKLNRLV